MFFLSRCKTHKHKSSCILFVYNVFIVNNWRLKVDIQGFVIWPLQKAKNLTSNGVVKSIKTHSIRVNNKLRFVVMFDTKFGISSLLGTSYSNTKKNKAKLFNTEAEAQHYIEHFLND